jgi:hypothetical protein
MIMKILSNHDVAAKDKDLGSLIVSEVEVPKFQMYI